jgi:D-glycero-D-manno-heptose 1,7-bisphosphate phosphatase
MTIKTIFLDRDGVINKEVNYLYKIKDFEFIEGIFEACNSFQLDGYQIIIITNQSGISRGIYSKNEFELLSKWMKNEFENRNIKILDIFHCPHNSTSRCDCRKPKPGLFFQAKNKYGIDMEKSWMIGDKESDIEAAINAGIKYTILVRSGHQIDEFNSKASFIIDSIKESKKIISNF